MVTGRRMAENSTRLSTAAGSDFEAELEQPSALRTSISEISKHPPDLGPIHNFPRHSVVVGEGSLLEGIDM